MISFFKKAWEDVSKGKNLEHYITLLFILIILFLDIFNLASPDIMTEITLAVLALIVFTSLHTRERLDMVQKNLEKP